jgi:hypothetical protein
MIYGSQFNSLIALKALAYLDDRALAGLSADMRRELIAAIKATNLQDLPVLAGVKNKAGPA